MMKYPAGTALHVPLVILYHIGMRISEVCGLTWQDIDFKKKVIKLRRQVVYLARRGYYFTTPKTKTSVRDIVMDSILVEELMHWKNLPSENESALGDSYVYAYKDSEEKVLQQSKGLPMTQNTERVKMVCTHSDERLVRKQYVELRNIYTHNTFKMQEDAVKIFEETLQKINHDNCVVVR